MKRIGILGDTSYTRTEEFNAYLDEELEKYNGKLIIVTGTKEGTEQLAVNWADTNGIRIHIIANEDITERERTKKIAKLIDKAIIFWNSKNLVTQEISQMLFHRGVPVDTFLYHPDGKNN